MERTIGGVRVCGVDVDPQTRCEHYHTDVDVIAIRFPCCGDYYPCFECHEAVANHAPKQWPPDRFAELAVLCGVCGAEHSVAEYLECASTCPDCGARFNPGCLEHRERYFEQR